MAKQKRDNEYYLKRLQKDQPALYASVRAGTMSVNKARQLAGLGGVRTRLHELKNAWGRATVVERAEFVRWAGLAASAGHLPPVSPSAPPTGSAFDGDGAMHMWASQRVEEIRLKRRITKSDFADELGIPRDDGSIGMAVARGTRIRRPAVVAAVDAWLVKNASV